jgi:mannose-6-phosphate isomerase-like protein (cupin superfamily)
MDPRVAAENRTGPGYVVRRQAEAPVVPCPCGQSTRILTHEDGSPANFHVTFITDSVKHYHEHCTELYYILEGTGRLELNGDVVEVEPGMLILIEPFTAHRLRSEAGVRTLVIGVPAWHPEDEFFVEDDPLEPDPS